MTQIKKAYSTGNKVNEIVSVADFGAVGDGALTGTAQEGAGTGTDDSAALQLALDHIRDNGGTLNFDGSKVYRCDSVLTLLRNSSTGPTNYNVQFNGAALDFSNLATGDYLQVGADSLANIATDVGHIKLADGRIFGQQAGNPGSGTAATNTATTAISLRFCYNIVLDHMIGHRCYIGLKTMYVFPLVDIMSSFKRCIIGVFVDDVTNDSTFIRTEAAQCRFGMIAQPAGALDSGKCVNNRFDGFRAEGCEVGVHLDTGSNNAGIGVFRDWHFDNPYFAGNTYDYMRLGTVADPTTSSARGADSTDRIYGLRVRGGNWGITPTATKAGIAFASNSNVRQAIIDIPLDVDVANTIVNTPRYSEIISTAQADATSDTFKHIQYGSFGERYTKPNKELQTMTNVDATPSVLGFSNFETNTGAITITDFDDGETGQEITVISRAAITFDGGGGTNLETGSASIVTASGDLTKWLCEDGTTWNLLAFVDMSADNSGGA